MAGESILVVEDVPESLRFTASALRRDGYRVSIASTAEQALSTLRFLQPDLILVDFMLPGMNGLDLTVRIRQDPRLQKAVVVALTAASAPEMEQRAKEAGCDGYLTKPIDARTLLARIRDFLDFGKQAENAFSSTAAPEEAPAAPGIPGLPQSELEELQESFLKAGKGLSRQMLAGLDSDFDAGKAGRTVHQWIGTAGLLGFAEIARLAREVETILRTAPAETAKVTAPLTRLARAFYHPAGTIAETMLQSLARALGGKRVALIGLDGDAADLMCAALEQVGARARLFDTDQSPYSEAVSICHVAVVHVRPETTNARWLANEAPGLPGLPTLFYGSADALLSADSQAHGRADGLVVEGCSTAEVLQRLRLAVTQPRHAASAASSSDPGEVVIAHADAAAHASIEARMRRHGLRCRLASNGPDALLLLHTGSPRVAVLDVELDAFEALAAIRAEALPVRTIFSAPPAQEEEVQRAFSLGAQDYVVQPFSAAELVARVNMQMA